MPMISSGRPDPKVSENLEKLLKLEKNWFWRGIGLTVAMATVISAIFQILSYCK